MENNDPNHCYYSDLPSPMAYLQIRLQEEAQVLINKDRIIEMAWEDRTPFEAIKFQFGLHEADVKSLMKKELAFSSYKLWRKRVENCKTKHMVKRNSDITRFKSNMQRTISNNKISKRK